MGRIIIVNKDLYDKIYLVAAVHSYLKATGIKATDNLLQKH